MRTRCLPVFSLLRQQQVTVPWASSHALSPCHLPVCSALRLLFGAEDPKPGQGQTQSWAQALVPSQEMLAVLAEGVQVLGAGFPQPSLQQEVLLFARYLLGTHPDLVLEAQSKAEPLLCCPHLPM